MQQVLRRRRTRASGFTLIELMVVLVILGAIASAAGIAVMGQLKRSRIRETLVRARTIQNATQAYQMEEGGECPAVAVLTAGGFLDSTKDNADAWGNAFVIECGDDAIHVHSAGPDEQLGTEDDIGF